MLDAAPFYALMVVWLVLATASASSQGVSSAISGQSGAQQPPGVDPVAATLLQKAIDASGGTTSLSKIVDYTATGDVTYYQSGRNVSGAVTIRARKLDQLRVDSQLSGGGQISVILSHGQGRRTFGSTWIPIAAPNRNQQSLLIMPSLDLIAVLNDHSARVSLAGSETINGISASKVHVAWNVPPKMTSDTLATASQSMDVFVDPTTLLVIAIRHTEYSKGLRAGGPPRELRFSDFRQVNGLAVPFSVDEYIDSQHTCTIHVSSVVFNSGLTNDIFEP